MASPNRTNPAPVTDDGQIDNTQGLVLLALRFILLGTAAAFVLTVCRAIWISTIGR